VTSGSMGRGELICFSWLGSGIDDDAQSAINFYTHNKVWQRSILTETASLMGTQTTTSLWRADDATSERASVNMPTHS